MKKFFTILIGIIIILGMIAASSNVGLGIIGTLIGIFFVVAIVHSIVSDDD